MGLENTFGNVENLPEEKKLGVITSKEAILKDLEDYFEKTIRHPLEEETDDYFLESQKFLASYEITPELIKKFNEKFNGKKTSKKGGLGAFFSTSISRFHNKSNCKELSLEKRNLLGIFFSSLIQTSYNQGFNNFEIGEVNASNFCKKLRGEEDDLIKIKVEKIDGSRTLFCAKYCSFEVGQIEGDFTLYGAGHCLLKAQIINGGWTLSRTKDCSAIMQTLSTEGGGNLDYAKNCSVEITNYGETMFGISGLDGLNIKNCTIYSPNQETLEKLEKASCLADRKSNSFILGHIPKKKV